jgi:hypothetical protein
LRGVVPDRGGDYDTRADIATDLGTDAEHVLDVRPLGRTNHE